MPAGDVVDERPECRCRGRRQEQDAARLGRGHAAGDQSDGGAFNIPLDAGDLAGEAEARIGFELEVAAQDFWRIEEGIAVQPAEARELGVLQPGDLPENLGLHAVFHLGLEADHVPQRAQRIILPELHDGVRLHRRVVRVGEADRLHRPEPQRFTTALGHHLDGQTAVEVGHLLPVLEFVQRCCNQRIDERVVLPLVHWAVEVISAGAPRTCLIVARLCPDDRQVDAVVMDDRRDGVEEGEGVLAGQPADRLSERRRREGARRDDDILPVGRRQARDLLAGNGDVGMGLKRPRHGCREAIAVDG